MPRFRLCPPVATTGIRRSGVGRARQVLGPLVPETAVHEPADQLPPTVDPRHPADPAGGQIARGDRQGQVLGDLRARLCAADDQHGPVGELAGLR